MSNAKIHYVTTSFDIPKGRELSLESASIFPSRHSAIEGRRASGATTPYKVVAVEKVRRITVVREDGDVPGFRVRALVSDGRWAR